MGTTLKNLFEMAADPLMDDDLVDYEDDAVLNDVTEDAASKTEGGDYAGVHSSGFRDLLLKPELIQAIVDCGFEAPSEVQHQCIPQAILGTDVICQAKSGMGKTAVFVIASLQQLEPVDGECHVVVVCHARELAFQIAHEYERFSKYMPNVRTAVFYGGIPVASNIAQLKNEPPHIVVGTPGRTLGLVRDKHLNLKNVRHFIVDECDRVLESLDMRRDVQEIFRSTPHEKQVMMFSATLSEEMSAVCEKFMHEPMKILINSAKLTLHGLQQHFVKLAEEEKNRKLNNLLDALQFNQVVIFVNKVARAKALNKLLVEFSFPSICIHSALRQEERIARYQAFKRFEHRILVCTDLFGRGIDVERVNIVINYDLPTEAEPYLHRVGRAGRFGTRGLAISFVSSDEDEAVLAQICSHFEVDISELPDTIDTSSYMNA